jgi:hypothetical protein
MGLLDNALGGIGADLDIVAIAKQFGVDVNEIAAQVGLTPEQVGSILQALGMRYNEPGDTAEQAAEDTGLPLEQIRQVITQIGGEDALAKLSALLGGAGGLLSKL